MEATSVSVLSVRDGRNLKTVPWGHQRNALDFARKVLYKPQQGPPLMQVLDGGGLMAAMGMGTGKSLVGTSLICNLGIDAAPCVLIAAPLRVVPVWPKQIDMHAGIPVRVLALDDSAGTVTEKRDAAKQQMEVAKARGERLVIVVNYESLWREPFNKWALAQRWGLTILDESHRIKQPSGKAAMFCARLRDRSVYRVCLTGTPMPHSPLDVYSQFRFLRPDIFGTNYHCFKQDYSVMGGFQNKQIVQWRNLDLLEDKMRAITFRVGKDVLDLPSETHVTYECALSPGAQRVYDDLDREFTAGVDNGTVTAANAMVKLMRLQQITGGFIPLDGQTDVRPVDQVNAKADLLQDTLEDIAADEPIVVFTKFIADLDAVHEIGRRMNRGTLELSGRKDQISAWQQGSAPILAVQIDSGGEGVDMTRARYSIYYSIGYSRGKYDQSLSRVHRPGQTRPVTHIHLLVSNSVDGRVMRALKKRGELVDAILDEIKHETTR